MAIRLLPELVERRHTDRPTVLCTQYSPADRHGRLGGGVQANAMTGRLVHGAVRIDLGDVNVRKLLSEKKWRYAPARRVIRKRRGHQFMGASFSRAKESTRRLLLPGRMDCSRKLPIK